MKAFISSLLLLVVTTQTIAAWSYYRNYQIERSRWKRETEDEIPFARRLEYREIRRKPPALLQMMGPISFGKQDGNDAKIDVPGLGKFGAGDVKNNILKFIPEGMRDVPANGGTYQFSDRPNLGYMERETTAGKTVGSSGKMNMLGIGTIEMGQEKEQGTGLLDFSKNLFPFLQLPGLKSEVSPDTENTAVDQSLADVYYPKSKSYVEDTVVQPKTPFNNDIFTSSYLKKDKSEENPFEEIETRKGGLAERIAKFGSKMMGSKTKVVEDADLLPQSSSNSHDDENEGFIQQRGKLRDTETENAQLLTASRAAQQNPHTRVPLSQLVSEKEVLALCAKFAPIAAKHCYVPKIEAQYVERCQGYNADCAKFQAQARPLGAIANSFSSGVGLTYYDWGVNGIPYYPTNEEGGIGNGHHGKIDFGSWGGGYSDNLGVRDYWSQTGEFGANWYEGTYGYKTGWSVPIVQSMGVEGGGGTQVHVPVKEGEIGRPISITNGYHVGPYLGLADRVGVDWYNGGVSVNNGFASPFIGVGVNTGTSIAFPSVSTIMNRMGMTDDLLNQMAASAIQTPIGDVGTQSESRVRG